MRPRLALLADPREELWPSMDLCADMLASELAREPSVEVELVRPAMRSRFSRGPLRGSRLAWNADRLFTRWWDYPRHVRRIRERFDLYHVCDHSYAQLLLDLPGDRTGVLVHDLDAFRSTLEPELEPRPAWFRALAARTLEGLRRAALVFCTTEVMRQEIAGRGICELSRVVKVPLGAAPEFTATARVGEDDWIDTTIDGPFLLHVGTCTPRKRVDILLETFARVREGRTSLQLVQAGGTWTEDDRARIERLGIARSVKQLRDLSRASLASLYRRAAAVLVTSEREGFGLPVLEALSCGTLVIASRLATLHEVAEGAAAWCPPGDVDAWASTVDRALSERSAFPSRAAGLARAGEFSWRRHAEVVAAAYGRLPRP